MFIAALWGALLTPAAHALDAARLDGMTFSASDTSATEHEADLVAMLREGIRAYHDESYGRARGYLLTVFAQRPLLRLRPDAPTAAYYLGHVLDARGEHVTARTVWLTAVRLESTLPAADVRSADAYVRSVFDAEQTEQYSAAAETYLRLIQWTGTPRLTTSQRKVVERHGAQMNGLEAALQRDGVNRASGTALASWWRSVDPNAATLHNERIVEHLRRVSQAEDAYASKHGVDGLDDRGEVFVRLGAPTNQTSVDFHTPEMLRRLRDLRRSTRNYLQISLSAFADNEFWLYQHDDVSYYYLFVDDGNEYRIGKTTDLIPPGFMAGAHRGSGRGGAKIDVALEAMRAIYEQLSRYHPDFGANYAEISTYMSEMEIEQRRAAYQSGQFSEFISNRRRGDYSEVVQQTGFMNGRDPTQHPQSFMRRSYERAVRDADRAAFQREQDAPAVRSETSLDVPVLPAALRSARFLNPDGTTRTELFWSIAPAGRTVGSRSVESIVNVSVNQYAADYRIEQHHRHRRTIPAGIPSGKIVYPSSPFVVDSLTAPFHLKVQWDLHRSTGPESSDDPLVLRSAAARIDSLHPLDGQGKHLEMSDLVPLLLPDTLSPPAAGERWNGKPLPFERVPAGTSVGLYFEVYHLAYTETDQTSYTISYRVERSQPGENIIERLFTGDEITQTSAATSYGTNSRRTRETIALDGSAWRPGETIRVTVTVSDDVTGQTYERATTFEVTTPVF